MRRLFWVALGASAGVLIARQLRQTAQAMTPENVVARIGSQAQAFWNEVRSATAEREAELRVSFGLDDPTPDA